MRTVDPQGGVCILDPNNDNSQVVLGNDQMSFEAGGTGVIKLGDGITRYASLPNIGGTGGGSTFPDFTGSGSPEGVQTAAPGQTYKDTSNGALWAKASGSGNTGWVGGLTLPIADPTGVTVTTTPNVIKGSGDADVLTFPAETTAFALKIAGDAFPRLIIGVDPTDFGSIFLGDGTFDPTAETSNISTGAPIDGHKSLAIGALTIGFAHVSSVLHLDDNALFQNSGKGPIVHDASDGHTYRLGTLNGLPTATLVT